MDPLLMKFHDIIHDYQIEILRNKTKSKLTRTFNYIGSEVIISIIN